MSIPYSMREIQDRTCTGPCALLCVEQKCSVVPVLVRVIVISNIEHDRTVLLDPRFVFDRTIGHLFLVPTVLRGNAYLKEYIVRPRERYTKQIRGFLSGVKFSICLHEQTKATKVSCICGVRAFCHLAIHPILTAHSYIAIASVRHSRMAMNCSERPVTGPSRRYEKRRRSHAVHMSLT